MPAPEWVAENWPGSAMVLAVRCQGSRDGKPIDETRYYVTSLRTSGCRRSASSGVSSGRHWRNCCSAAAIRWPCWKRFDAARLHPGQPLGRATPNQEQRPRGGAVDPEQTSKEQRTLSRFPRNLQLLWQESQPLPEPKQKRRYSHRRRALFAEYQEQIGDTLRRPLPQPFPLGQAVVGLLLHRSLQAGHLLQQGPRQEAALELDRLEAVGGGGAGHGAETGWRACAGRWMELPEI